MTNLHFILLAILLGIICLGLIYFLFKLMRTQVPYVPTSKKVAKKMIELGKLDSSKTVYELGCGDGRVLFWAEKSGSKLIGYELIEPLVYWARLRNFLRKGNIQLHSKDFFKANIDDADVVLCYLFPGVMERFFEEKYPRLKKGTLIVSHGFPMKRLTHKKKEMVGREKIWVYEK